MARGLQGEPTMGHDVEDGLAAALAALRPEIRQMLAEDLPVDRQRSEEAFAAQRWGQLREQVHRVKGSAQFCRLQKLQGICIHIEGRAGADTAPDASTMVEFSAEIARILLALKA